MNNFKKLLASAMALTMVTSVMPAATDVNAATYIPAVCDHGVQLVREIVKATGDDLYRTSFTEELTILWKGVEYNESIYDYVSIGNNLALIENIVDYNCFDEGDEMYAQAQYIVGAYNAVTYLTKDGGYNAFVGATTGESGTTLDFVRERIDTRLSAESLSENNGYYDEAVAVLDLFATVDENYRGAFDTETLEDFDALYEELQYNVDAADTDWIVDELEEYVDLIESNIEKFIDEETKEGDTQKSIVKSEVTAFLKALEEDDTYKEISFEEGNYNRYKNYAEVEELVASIEEMYDSIDEVEEVTNRTRFEAYSDFLATKKAGKYNGVLDDLIKNMKMDDFEVYETFKEEVVDVVYTFEAREYSNYYANRSDKSPYITVNGWEKVKDDFGAELIETFDRETGTFGWDELAAHMAEVEANYNALTEGLEGIDAINVEVSDKEAILAADDALFFFGDGDVTGNLTTAQKRVVRDAERKVNELLEAYRSKFGTIEATTGWVDMGNGNWNYFEADGTAPTKWICTAPNTWYYVQNGNMMRNYWVWRDANSAYYVGDDGVMVYGPTTVNGYELDANGLWHR